MAKATPDQLQNLPGFGQVKVKNIRNTFEKPFRNQATTSLSTLASQSKSQHHAETTSSTHAQQQLTMRQESPVWDIEGDIDEMTDGPSSKVFDIELDL